LVSDVVVMIALFVGSGVGLSNGPLGSWAAVMGLLSGLAVATIFHFRNELENQHGKSVTKQPGFLGFETEDVLYLLPLITYWDALQGFLLLSAIGTPVFAILIIHQYRIHLRKGAESL
jgi:archaetidylinositol phosphate synthase